MKAREAFKIILTMAHSSYSKNFGPSSEQRKAFNIVEEYLKYYEDTVLEQEALDYEYGAIDLELDDNHYRE